MLSFFGDLFTLVIAVAALIGFMVVLAGIVEYLDERDRLMTTDRIVRFGQSAEDEIADLRDEAIGDIFDHARQMRLQRHVGEPDGGDHQ